MININSASVKKWNFRLLIYDAYPFTSVLNNVLAFPLLHRVLCLLIYPGVKTHSNLSGDPNEKGKVVEIPVADSRISFSKIPPQIEGFPAILKRMI